MISIQSVKELETLLKEKLQQKHSVLFLLDIDDTIITPLSKLPKSYNNCNLIDTMKDIMRKAELEKKYDLFDECGNLISLWRLERVVELTDKNWPSFIDKIREKNTIDKITLNHSEIYGLTQINGGKFGHIASVEDWREKELKSLDIIFSKLYSNEKLKLIDGKNPATYSKGIFYTGDSSKGDVLRCILKNSIEYDMIIFIDDKIEHIIDIKKTCNILDIECFSVQFIAKQQKLFEVENNNSMNEITHQMLEIIRNNNIN